MKNQKMLGILGGTFDPVHLGHLKIAEEILQKLAFDEILFLPNQVPPHREKPQASLEQRIKMIELAIEAQPQFKLDLTEAERPGPSYMLDTLKILQQKYPEAVLSLILGADVFSQFHTWHRYEEILDYAHLMIIPRSTAERPSLFASAQISDPKKLTEKKSGYIYEFHLDPISISSTKIREMLKKGEPLDSLLPKKVLNFIRENQIYL